MLNEIINWIFSALLGAASTFIITLVTQNKALKKSMIALLRGQIVSNCEQYNRLGYLPDYARYTINELGTNYSDLGGNHGIEQLIIKTNQLPPCILEHKEKER